MSYQIKLGKFDPSTEFVDLAGTFNNWGGMPDLNYNNPFVADSMFAAADF